MSKFEFVSCESYPHDQYVKEVAYLCFEGKYQVAYARKVTKNGGLFWGVCTIGVTKDGAKTYIPTFLQDSNFLEKEIKSFLEARSWEKKSVSVAPNSMKEVAEEQDLPF